MPLLFRKKQPTPCPRCGLTYCTGNSCAPSPEPFDARAWLERCCARLKKEAYGKPMPNGKVCGLAELMVIYRALLKEYVG